MTLWVCFMSSDSGSDVGKPHNIIFFLTEPCLRYVLSLFVGLNTLFKQRRNERCFGLPVFPSLYICSHLMMQVFTVAFKTSNTVEFSCSIKVHHGSKVVKIDTLVDKQLSIVVSVLLSLRICPFVLFLWLSVFVHACMFRSLKQKIRYKHSVFTHACKAL